MAVDLGDYNDVASRIAEFRAKYPEGSLRPVNTSAPYAIERIGDQMYLVVVAAAYRNPDDPTPGVGMAYEPVPGRTPYTRFSELQNAETAAWGRAIVAALAADTRKGVASQEEVRNRVAEREPDSAADRLRSEIKDLAAERGWPLLDVMHEFARRTEQDIRDAPGTMLNGFLASLRADGMPDRESTS
ncbi:hypothetical protein [Amycolatopsis sp. NPDC021455]|uniref:hypothetical protein n=1 Tax=Amycolatopsis sp. NPDC021455 TaxID=3154901 RepID=UPI0033F6C96C